MCVSVCVWNVMMLRCEQRIAIRVEWTEYQSQNKTKQGTTKMPRTKKNKNRMERTEREKKYKRKKQIQLHARCWSRVNSRRNGAVQLNRQKKKNRAKNMRKNETPFKEVFHVFIHYIYSILNLWTTLAGWCYETERIQKFAPLTKSFPQRARKNS